jgi:hypothetical protein
MMLYTVIIRMDYGPRDTRCQSMEKEKISIIKIYIKAPKEIIDQVVETVSNWKKYAKEAGVQIEKINEINKNLKLKLTK